MPVTNCSNCPVPDENGISGTGPLQWCKEVYECPVASKKPPTRRFHFFMTLLRLQKAGYTIDNNRLTLDEWQDLGEFKDLIENHKESARLAKMSMEMATAVTLSQFRKHKK